MGKKQEFYVGVDLGRTSLRVGVVDKDGQILAQARRKTHLELGTAGVVTRLAQTIERTVKAAGLKPKELGGVGVGVPGLVEAATGRVRATDLGPNWGNLPLAERLEARLGLKIYIDNYARAGAVGEHTYGAARGIDDMAAIFVGAAVGGGLILGGELHAGFRGSAGEVGQMVIAADNKIAGKTGQPGTAEPLASLGGIERQVRTLVAGGHASVVPQLIQTVGQGQFSSRVMCDALSQNDAVMQAVLTTAQRALGLLTADLVNSLDLQMVVFGGSIPVRLGPRFLAPIRQVAYANIFNRRDLRQVKLVSAKLKETSVVVGAAVLARRMRG